MTDILECVAALVYIARESGVVGRRSLPAFSGNGKSRGIEGAVRDAVRWCCGAVRRREAAGEIDRAVESGREVERCCWVARWGLGGIP